MLFWDVWAGGITQVITIKFSTLIRRSPLSVLAYHDVSDPVIFEAQIKYCKENYNLVTLQDLEKSFYSKVKLPPRSLAITFDDAYPSLYHVGLPILKKYNVPAAVFVITDLVETDQPYWWDEVPYYAPPGWTEGKKKSATWEVKNWPNHKRLEFIQKLKTESNKRKLIFQQLSWEQLNELQDSGVTIANHTADHPILNQCSQKEVRSTIQRGQQELIRRGFPGAKYFAYPNGNIPADTEQVLSEVGVKLAFLFDHQLNRSLASPYRISRLSMNTRNSVPKTKLILSGLHSTYLNLRKAIQR